MTQTANFGLPKYDASWFDQNPGRGPTEMVSEALENMDALAASINLLRRETIVLSASDLLNALASPPTILPAVDADVIAQELYALAIYQHLTTDYTTDATLFYIGPRSSPTSNYVLQPFGANLVDGTFTAPVVAKIPAVNPMVNSLSFFQDQDLVLTHNGSGEMTGGDGIVVVRLFYPLVGTD